MQIERTRKEVIIRLPATVDTDDLQDFLDYARYKELTSNFSFQKLRWINYPNDVNKGW